MKNRLYKLWRDYNLSIVLAGLFLVSWILHALTGWMKFSAEQAQHAQAPSMFGKDGYIWNSLLPPSRIGNRNSSSCSRWWFSPQS